MVLKRSAKKFPWTPQKKRNVWTLKIVIIYSQFSLILPRGVLTTLHLASHDTPCQYTRSYYYLNVMHTRCIQLGILTLKGLFTNFEYIKKFSCSTERNIFYERFISIKPLWLEIIVKKGCTKSVRVIYIIYIIVLGRTDFVHPFFSIISSQSGIIEMDLSQKMFLLVGHEKFVIYSKLVNNPFK